MAQWEEPPRLLSADPNWEETELIFRDLMFPRKNGMLLQRVSVCSAKLYVDSFKFSS